MICILRIVFLLLIGTSAWAQEVDSVLVENLEYRKELNLEFSDMSRSPLSAGERASFKGLPFYEIDPAYRVMASLEVVSGSEFKKMKTSTSRMTSMRVYGILVFELKGKTFRVPVYQSESLLTTPGYKDYLFFPFTDLTTGDETYGGGRYIDLTIPRKGNALVLDFNKAYNPTCAYNPNFSCPFVPSENSLDIAIRAGVKYEGKH